MNKYFVPLNSHLGLLTSLILLGLAFPTLAQEHIEHQPHESGHFRIGLVIGHTLIPTTINGEREGLLIPSWGLDVEYWFTHQWGLGLHNDIEVETFEVLSENGEFVERVYPVVLTLDVLWRPWKGLVFLAGPGIEIEQSRNLQVFRLGVEYEIDIFPGWDLSPNFFYDARSNAFDTWSLGLGVGKRF